jgi:hypothetical protein
MYSSPQQQQIIHSTNEARIYKRRPIPLTYHCYDSMNVTTENLYQVIDIMFPPRENEEPTNETFYRIIDDFTDGNNNNQVEGVEAEG